jgi:excisionase family DNA binding protein
VARASRAWLTPGEVAERLKVSRATVYALCADGRLGHVRVGLSIRISEDQVERCLEGQVARVP